MDNLSTEELGMLFPVVISDPDPHWPDYFMLERTEIKKRLDSENNIFINHIGSTAIPGLQAKPTIDILIEIPEETDAEWLVRRLVHIGYHFIPKPENPPPHMMFVKGYSEKGMDSLSYHVHIRYTGEQDELLFRDYLRKHPEAVREYAELKIKLADVHKNNREAYTEGKTGFINRIVHEARKENTI